MRADHDIRVEIPGLRPPTVHTCNADNLERLWNSLHHLPMSRFQHYLLERRLTGPCASRDIIRDLDDAPVLTLPLGEHELRITWAD